MRYAVEAWATEYGSPVEDAEMLASPAHPPLLDVEVPAADWAPRDPEPSLAAPASVLFTDGVRRIDARVWIDGDDDRTYLGICASYAAGAVRAELGTAGHPSVANVVACEVGRGLFTTAPGAVPITTRHASFGVRAVDDDSPDRLSLALQQRMGELEVALAGRAEPADLVVIDGPLRGRTHVPNAIGYVKTHHVAYLPSPLDTVVAALRPGQRTPLFVTTSSWSRYSWYSRLPGADGHRWAGVVRGEASADLDDAEAARLADRATAVLPRFSSRAHKDPRAPQNLYPIAGLERALRHRMGDPALILRSLRAAAGSAVSS